MRTYNWEVPLYCKETMELLNQAERLYKDRKFKELISLLNDELLVQHANAILYSYKARAFDKLGETELCMAYAEAAISHDPSLPYGFLARGNAWYDQMEIKKAIEDYTLAIQLDQNMSTAYYNRGNTWLQLSDHEQAVTDYTKAISLGHGFAYYNRAMVYHELGDYNNAIADYQSFLDTEIPQDSHYNAVAKKEIEKINARAASPWLDQFSHLIKKIKELLLFEESELTHYTSLSSTSALLLDQGPFRVSEGSYLNDTSEGRELFKYLIPDGSFSVTAKMFIEKPFIGSFVPGQQSDDLTMWRLYGKEKQAEAKGCSLTFNKIKFIRYLETSISPAYGYSVDFPQTEGEFTFYRVAYKNDSRFIIPGKDAADNEQLNYLLRTLKEHMSNYNIEYDQFIKKALAEINYLFKSGDYQNENEVRLVIDGTGFFKKILKDIAPPRVYIELISLKTVLHKIVIGPKVERPEEWAAAFNYQLKQDVDQYTNNPSLKAKVEILISNLPYK